ncbi:MAG: helix-turn-helix transcriptional regulator [Eubacterium sp.]|nr:helix-turn-helix transcriptional regulator [Eubacterium sp.]
MKTRLRDLREDNDLTQEQAAIIGCISKKSYERYENGIRDIPLEIVKKYSEFYNVPIDYIAFKTNIKKPYPKK